MSREEQFMYSVVQRTLLNSLNPYYEWFQSRGRRELIRNPLGTPLHIVYTQHNLQFEGQTRFGSLYTHPTGPFLKHQ